MIPIFVRKALAGEPLTLAGDGLQSRRFVYVEDLADGVVRGLGPQAGGRVYNLVGDEERHGTRDRRRGRRPGRGRRDRPHRGPAPPTSPAPRSRAPARPRSSAGARRRRSRRACGATSLGTSRRRGVRDAGAARAPDVAPAAPAAPDAAVRIARALVADGRRGGGCARVLSGLDPGDRPHGRIRSHHRRACRQHARRVLAMALDGPRRALWTFTGWALAAAGLAIVYMGEFREALNLAGPDESRVLLGLAGGALAVAIADAGLRLRRSGVERLRPTAPRGPGALRASRSPAPPARSPSSTAGSARAVRRHEPGRCNCPRRGAAGRLPRSGRGQLAGRSPRPSCARASRGPSATTAACASRAGARAPGRRG